MYVKIEVDDPSLTLTVNSTVHGPSIPEYSPSDGTYTCSVRCMLYDSATVLELSFRLFITHNLSDV